MSVLYQFRSRTAKIVEAAKSRKEGMYNLKINTIKIIHAKTCILKQMLLAER